jgi:sugar O-acyltransferase (sialic acid O-acetyltransferase NeuD family)
MRVLNEFIGKQGYSVVAIVDQALRSGPLDNIPLLNGLDALDAWLLQRDGSTKLFGAVAIGGGNGRDRQKLSQLFQERGITVVSLIHPTAFIASNAIIAAGSQILARAIVGSCVQIGPATVINTGASIDHDCVIGAGSHIGPGAVLAGQIHVGENVFVGIGAIILPRLLLGDGAVIGAGSVVTRSVLKNTVVFGNPARTKSII